MKWLRTYENYSNYYRACSIFTNPEERKLCELLNDLRYWLVKDYIKYDDGGSEVGLGLKNVIDEVLNVHLIFNDYNDQYQIPFKILKSIKRGSDRVELYSDIIFDNDKYFHEKFKNLGLIKDQDDEFHYVNKLNTNYSDLSELLVKPLYELGLTSIINMPVTDIKKILLENKNKIVDYIRGFYDIEELKTFIRNSKSNSEKGEENENYVRKVLENYGMKLLYKGSDGDFIDMIFGIDFIMEHNGKLLTCQIKSNEKQIKESLKNPYYTRVDYIILPEKYKNKIIIYKRVKEGGDIVVKTIEMSGSGKLL